MHNKVNKCICIATTSLMLAVSSMVILPTAAQANISIPKVTYTAHTQDIGWMKEETVGNSYVGTTGQARRMEALKINVQAPEGVTFEYRAHVEDIGWMDWVTTGNEAGTTGQAKRMEALELVVKGLEGYEVKYRAHVEDIGWMDWVTAGSSKSITVPENGTYAGTVGEAKRMEALEIIIIQKAEEPKHETKPQTNIPPPDVEEKDEDLVHVHTFDDGVITKEPTCISQGEKTKTCTTCGEEKIEKIIDVNAHKFEKVPDVAATCETFGQKNCKLCTICGRMDFGYVKPLGHEWDTKYTVDKEATCKENGQESIHCLRCSKTKDVKSIEKRTHEYIEVKTEATCTSFGYTKQICKYCNAVSSSEQTESPKGHTFTEYTSNNDATCYKDGTKTAICNDCGFVNTIQDVGTKLNHNFQVISEKVEPTCEKDGKEETRRCSICNKIEGGYVIKATGHQFVELSEGTEHNITSQKGKIAECIKCKNQVKIEEDIITFGGHEWDSDTRKCSCGSTKHDDIWWNAFSSESTADQAIAIWFAGFTCDMNKCDGFDSHFGRGKTETILEGRRGDVYTITMIAPNAKDGYVFDGWYEVEDNTHNGEGTKITNICTKNHKAGSSEDICTSACVSPDGRTITVPWKDMDKGFEARYKPANQ